VELSFHRSVEVTGESGLLPADLSGISACPPA
jgi:hypothetical protein